jgi:predicted acylesterase/phospholipase RssA
MYIGVSLSGGASRGIYQLGALHAAYSQNLLTEVKYFCGTSIGAVICLLLAVGYEPMDIYTYICTNDIGKVIDQVSLDLKSVVNNWGLIDINIFKEYFRKIIILKWGGIPTFQELYNAGKVLICTSYKLKSTDPCVYFSYKTHPNMSCLDAVILSSNIPFLFRAINYDGDYYIDGGIFDNNPAYYLLDHIKEDKVEMTEDTKIFACAVDMRKINTPEESVIQNAFDYSKEIILACLFSQSYNITSKHIDYCLLETDLSEKIVLDIDNKMKISWFCNGLD